MATADERFEQVLIAADADKVAEARKTGVLRDVQIMGFESKNGYGYDPAAIQANRTRFEGMTVGLDHDYKLGPLTLDNTWGTLKNVNERGRRGDLHFNAKHRRTDEILHDVEFGTRPVALSPVCAKCVEETRDGKRVVTSFEATRVDVVINAATNRTMFNQSGPKDAEGRELPPPGSGPGADPRLEQALAKIAALEAKVAKIETTSPATVASDVKRSEDALKARGVNLEQFHDDFGTGKIR